ncbi:hypothetical protein BKP64_06085 [Marinobacter salinus]|uniref:Probable inorganic carbon transporter subunit DabA n=1 Tax=Marinobacter salinus TaxID=1874317 RepID=A0A1D9GJF6_9GAMM|nr:DUF2309 domain-containing protein [Marinobacter salinus]AOY87776.1 hypothetical protein BKP64_06085 [Marinobacter salinus]
MTAAILSRSGEPTLSADQREALARGVSSIPPSWPLDRWIAVNPWWGRRHLPAEQAAAIPGARTHTSMLMPASFYLDAWSGGRIRETDVRKAIAESGSQKEPGALVSALDRLPAESAKGAPSVLDLTNKPGTSSPLEAMRQQIARACALFFDVRQSRWLSDIAAGSLLESWLEQTRNDLLLDRKVGLKGVRAIVESLSNEEVDASEWALGVLNLSPDDLESLAQRLLFELIGWSSWCKGIDWRAELEGNQSGLCDQLLSILLVCEAMGVQVASAELRHQWQADWGRYRRALPNAGDELLWTWHRAYEIGYLRTLVHTLSASQNQVISNSRESAIAEFQAVFCIDVRSEVMRRHLEEVCPTTQTLGFAGFFGMPVTHQGLGPEGDTPKLPGLLAPAFRLADSTGDRQKDRILSQAADQRELARQAVRKAKYSSLSSFTLVETTGLAWAWKLVRDSLNFNKEAAKIPDGMHSGLFHRHGGDPVSDIEKLELAEQLLRGMSLTSGFASLLVFVGHGSHTDNNPHQAGLACGACGGQNGGVNAGLAARLINDPVVRTGLAERGIRIPDFTVAVAAEHCTVTDKIQVLDRAQVPDSYLGKLRKLETSFADAGQRTRRERATALNLNGLDDQPLMSELTRRTVNWSEVRPEWGLANNAAIVFAQRSRTRGLDLAGRAFLHDYDESLDPEGSVLESLMSAPMVVANWINLQYLGSVAAQNTFGSGNKLLHSVIGGNVGVIEGNDPDLRIGLSYQSVHDGQQWRHEPVRLSVFIDASRLSIEKVIAHQPDVAALVENHWLWLFRFSEGGVEQYQNGSWHKF